ncbi:MAG: hypothetical protein ACREEK_18960, partial [Bradyrhizobium sp.]
MDHRYYTEEMTPLGPNSFTGKAVFWKISRISVRCPTGKSILIYGNGVKPRNQKYFALSESRSMADIVRPARPEG